MDLYTFSFEFKGGSYASQFEGETLYAAIAAWIEKEVPTIYGIRPNDSKRFAEQFVGERPTEVGKLANVWFLSFLSGKSLGRLIVVKTCK